MLLLAQAAGLGLLPMLVGMLLSEVVDLDEFGRFYAGLGMAMTAVYIGGLGLDKIILKVIAAAGKSGDASDARGLRHAGPPLIIIGCLACTAILVPTFAFAQDAPPGEIVEFAAILLLMPLHAVLRFLFGTVAPHGGRLSATVFRDSLWMVLVATILAFLLGNGTSDLGVLHAVAIYVVASIASMIAMLLLRRRVEPKSYRSGTPTLRTRAWITHGLDYAANVMVYVFLAYSPLLYAQWVVDDDGQAALLAAAYQINVLPMAIAMTFCAVLLPDLASAVANHDRAALAAAQKRFLVLTAPPVLLVSLAILVLERPILRLYGEEYLAAGPAVRIILVGSVASSLAYSTLNTSQFLPGLRRATLSCMLLAAVGWIAFASSGGRGTTAIASMQVLLLLGCQALAILIGGRHLRTWST